MTLGLCRFTNADGGLVDWTYPGPDTDMQSPTSAGAVDGTTYKYYAQSLDMSQWEIGTGAYTASTGIFARTTVLFNSDGDTSLINFTNPPQVVVFEIPATPAILPPVLLGYLSGLTLSTAGSSATFGVAAGVATDSTSANYMSLASAYTKTISAWTVGTGNGALDTGTIANSTWYHVFLIKDVTSGTVDVLVSLSATSPTLPAGYTLFRRIGSMKTDSSGDWIKFTQNGDEFLWDTPANDVAAFTGTTVLTLKTLSTPSGIRTRAIVSILSASGSSSLGRNGVFSPDQGLTGFATGAVQFMNVGLYSVSLSGAQSVNTMIVRTNTSSQVHVFIETASTQMYINTIGWIDSRGRDG